MPLLEHVDDAFSTRTLPLTTMYMSSDCTPSATICARAGQGANMLAVLGSARRRQRAQCAVRAHHSALGEGRGLRAGQLAQLAPLLLVHWI